MTLPTRDELTALAETTLAAVWRAAPGRRPDGDLAR